MNHLLRPWVSLGVAATTATAIAFAPPVPDRPPLASAQNVRVTSQPVRLSAAIQPQVTAAALPDLLVDWVDRIVVPPSSRAAFPSPQFPPTVVGNSVGTFIENTYNAIEPWVQWGFEVAAYAVGWIPWVGWLSPQIMYFYNLGERIVRSITFNIADWIDHEVSFAQGLRNVIVDSINSFIYFANDQLAFWLPPLPPIPPIGGSLSTAAPAEDVNLTLAAAADTERGTDPESARRGNEVLETQPPTDHDTLTAPVGTETENEPDLTDGETVGESELVDDTDADAELSAEVELETEPEATDGLESAKDLDAVDDTKDTVQDDEQQGSDLRSDDGPDAAPETKSDTRTDTKSDRKSDRNADTKSDAKAGSGSDGSDG